jgi:hypothetical protein
MIRRALSITRRFIDAPQYNMATALHRIDRAD